MTERSGCENQTRVNEWQLRVVEGVASHFGDVDFEIDFDKASKSFGDVCGEDAGGAWGELGADACRRE